MAELRFSEMLRQPVLLLAFGFGSGLLPKAPGTWGTAVGVLFYLCLQPLPLWGYLLGVALLSFAGIAICGIAARRLRVHDHPAIVWDEIAGFLLVMTAVPAQPVFIALGFLLFRIFDILKPWPIGWLDRHVGGGLGIMLDDLLAACYSGILLQILLRFFS